MRSLPGRPFKVWLESRPDKSLIRALSFVGAWFAATGLRAQGVDEFERPPIGYSVTEAKDAVTVLEGRIASGTLKLPVGDDREVVRLLLREFSISEASQLLVFSQTSFQNDRIRPQHPRALYFNDNTYVGWVPGGLVEIATIDPHLGPVFYTFDPSATRPRSGPDGIPQNATTHFRRESDCLRCHGTFVRDIPALFARSVLVDSVGRPTGTLGGKLVDPTTPWSERWGGWYVTGTHGRARHRGNIIPIDGAELTAAERDRGANATDLKPFVDLSNYLAPGSDLVALLVFEHQLAVHNAITQAGHHTRRMLYYQQGVQRGLGEPVTTEPVYESTQRAVAAAAQDLLDALLSKDEVPLPEGGVDGNPAFRSAFEQRGRRTKDGFSLSQLDLKTRVFRYRCSPLIYHDSFTALPTSLKSVVFRRLKTVLNSLEADARYTYLQPGERRLLRDILRETLPEYAAVDL